MTNERADALKALQEWRNTNMEQGAGDFIVLNDHSWAIERALQPPAAEEIPGLQDAIDGTERDIKAGILTMNPGIAALLEASRRYAGTAGVTLAPDEITYLLASIDAHLQESNYLDLHDFTKDGYVKYEALEEKLKALLGGEGGNV